MRILLAQNSPYFPAHGGGGKSNRLLMEALAARGHVCRAVARIPALGPAETERYAAELAARGVRPAFPEEGIAAFERAGVEVRVVTSGSLRAGFTAQVEDFQPDAILTSTDDPAQLLLEAALRIAPSRVVYLARATLALPFGPDCAFPSEAKTRRIRAAAGVVGVSEYVARYIRQYAGIPATHVPISLLEAGDEAGDWSRLGRFDNEFVTMANPCAVKGIAIFLALADAFPKTAFAAVPTWGTNERDRAALALRPNVRLLDAVDDIGHLFARTRVLLAPSLWAEARSRIVVEAMLRGVPVLASDVGGIAEAKMGVPYLLPVNPIARYQTRLDERMVPVADVPGQDVGPWRESLARLLGDRAHYEEIAAASQAAARSYAAGLSVGPFEAWLGRMVHEGRHAAPASATREIGVPRVRCAAPPWERQSPDWRSQPDALTPEKRRLLALLLRKRAPAAAWFPAVGQASWPAHREGAEGARLFCFPYAGGGAAAFAGWRLPRAAVCPVRLPGRESRTAEAPFERMGALVEALAAAIEPFLDRPFAFFGHSMGAVVAFELARLLRKRGLPQPRLLVASGARAPQLRLHHTPPPDPSEEQFLAELRRLGGVPAEALQDPAVLRAILPALTADAALYRRYVYVEDAPLSLPIRAYGGSADPNILPQHLHAWQEQTAAGFVVRLFAGGHFFLHESRAEALAALAADLEPIC